jgi:hypothetical protein
MLVTGDKGRVQIRELDDQPDEFIGMASRLGANYQRNGKFLSFPKDKYRDAAAKLNERFDCKLPLAFNLSSPC